MIQRMDAGIERILDALASAGLEENTIVVFTSDNGPYHGGAGDEACARFNCDLNGSKGSVLEGGIRVPALIRLPGRIPEGERSDGFVHFTDWLPTITTMCGAPLSDSTVLDGVDVSGVLGGGAPTRTPRSSWQWNRYEPVAFCNSAQRNGEWKLHWPEIPEAMSKEPEDQVWYERGLVEAHWMMDLDRRPVSRSMGEPLAPRLFNLAEDPEEREDLAPRYPERVAQMSERWRSWFGEVEAERRAAQVRTGVLTHQTSGE